MLGPWNTLDCSVSDLIKRANVNSTRPGRRSNKLRTITIGSVSFGENPIIGCGRIIHENQTELMKDNTTVQVVPSSIVFIKQAASRECLNYFLSFSWPLQRSLVIRVSGTAFDKRDENLFKQISHAVHVSRKKCPQSISREEKKQLRSSLFIFQA